MEHVATNIFQVLDNTPSVISALLNNLSEDWTTKNEGENTWTAKEVVAHLIVCEETNWLVRAKIILSENLKPPFVPIDMVAHVKMAQGTSLEDLLKKFRELRENSIKEVKSFNLWEIDLTKTAIHPVLGEVSLQQLFATWATHDLTHIAQIARVIAKQNRDDVGPFITYLNILK